MFINFIPHIIALSNNSPIMNNKPTDTVKIINNRISAPNCVRSLRLKYNNTMLSKDSNGDINIVKSVVVDKIMSAFNRTRS